MMMEVASKQTVVAYAIPAEASTTAVCGEAAEGFNSMAAELVGTRDRDSLLPAMSSLFIPATTPSVIAARQDTIHKKGHYTIM